MEGLLIFRYRLGSQGESFILRPGFCFEDTWMVEEEDSGGKEREESGRERPSTRAIPLFFFNATASCCLLSIFSISKKICLDKLQFKSTKITALSQPAPCTEHRPLGDGCCSTFGLMFGSER